MGIDNLTAEQSLELIKYEINNIKTSLEDSEKTLELSGLRRFIENLKEESQEINCLIDRAERLERLTDES